MAGYNHGVNSETYLRVEGKEGDFWSLPVKMERETHYRGTAQVTLFACPKCGVAFIVT